MNVRKCFPLDSTKENRIFQRLIQGSQNWGKQLKIALSLCKHKNTHIQNIRKYAHGLTDACTLFCMCLILVESFFIWTYRYCWNERYREVNFNTQCCIAIFQTSSLPAFCGFHFHPINLFSFLSFQYCFFCHDCCLSVIYSFFFLLYFDTAIITFLCDGIWWLRWWVCELFFFVLFSVVDLMVELFKIILLRTSDSSTLSLLFSLCNLSSHIVMTTHSHSSSFCFREMKKQ